ncbi:MAG: Rrf2 family transcriptional regulator [Balneolaceae bacterium]
MLLSKSCIYALRATVLLASKKQDEFITIRELSDELDISFYFLTKVLQKLTRHELLESYKGPNGGVRLGRSSGLITFLDVVHSIDGEKQLEDCILGLPGCGVMKPCPMHDQWSQLKVRIMGSMKSMTISDLVTNKEIMNRISALENDGNFFEPK